MGLDRKREVEPGPQENAHAPSANADERDGSVGGCAAVFPVL